MICKENKEIGEKYYYLQHKSGLDVYVVPKKMSTSYAIFGTKFGSIDNRFVLDGKEIVLPDGIAHFLEHKMFEQEDGTDAFLRFAKTGANANAYTTFERTCYLFSATSKFYESLEILLDFVSHPFFTDATVQKEMGIIGQEIRMYDDNPGWQLYFGMLTGLYHANTVRIDTAGTTETIAEITPELLHTAYRAFYNPHNMLLCVCGDMDPEKVEEICDKLLPVSEKPDVKRLYPDEPAGIYKEFISKKLEVSMPMFAVGVKDNAVPISGDALAKKQAAYDILLDMIFGKSSPFYTRLYEAGLIDSSFSYEYECSEAFGHAAVSGSSNEPEKVYAAVKEEIKRYQSEGLDRAVFDRLHRASYAQTLRAFNSTEDIAGDLLVYRFEGIDLLDYPKIVASVTFEDVCTLLHDAFGENDFVLSTVQPLDKNA